MKMHQPSEKTQKRRIVAGLFMSLDGVVESPEQWQFPYFNDEMEQAMGAAMAEADTLLFGRRTFDEFAESWPNRDGPFAEFINSVPKIVVSRSRPAVTWRNSTLIHNNVAEELASLKLLPGKDILVTGSATLVRYLATQDLLDELRLMVCPVVVGHGKRLFDGDGEALALSLTDFKVFSTGVLSLVFALPRG